MEAEWCKFYVKLLEFTNMHLHKIFFQMFDLVKNAKKRRG